MDWKNATIGVMLVLGLTGCEDLMFWEAFEALDAEWQVTDDASFQQALTDHVPELLDTTLTPGVVIVALEDGQVVWGKNFGVADVDSGERMDPPSAVFQAASLSKAVTAWSVARAVEEGYLDWEDPVAPYLTRWELPLNGYDGDEVTVYRLLNHRAGMSVGGFVGWTADETKPSLEELLDGTSSSFGEAVEVAYPPGSEAVYSGGGYAVAQLLLEEVTGESFEDWTNREVCEALGLNMRMGYDPSLAGALVTPHDRVGDPAEHYEFVATSAAGLYASTTDYAAFISAWVDSGAGERGRGVLATHTVDRLIAQDMGIADATLGGRDVFTHTGANMGWKTVFVLDPATANGLVVFTNGDNGELVHEKIVEEWANVR